MSVNPLCASLGAAQSVYEFQCAQGGQIARYVSIQLSNAVALTLCEVQVCVWGCVGGRRRGLWLPAYPCDPHTLG